MLGAKSGLFLLFRGEPFRFSTDGPFKVGRVQLKTVKRLKLILNYNIDFIIAMNHQFIR